MCLAVANDPAVLRQQKLHVGLELFFNFAPDAHIRILFCRFKLHYVLFFLATAYVEYVVRPHLLACSIPIIILDQLEKELVFQILPNENIAIVFLAAFGSANLERELGQEDVVVGELFASLVYVSLGVFQVLFDVFLLGSVFQLYLGRPLSAFRYEIVQINELFHKHLVILFHFSTE